MQTEEFISPTGSACLCRWSNSFVLLENMLPHVGQATSLSWVWLRMCSLRRYLILQKASQPITETLNINNTITKNIFKLVFAQSYLSSGRREPAVVVGETVARHFQHDCQHVGRTTQDCWMYSVKRERNIDSIKCCRNSFDDQWLNLN